MEMHFSEIDNNLNVGKSKSTDKSISKKRVTFEYNFDYDVEDVTEYQKMSTGSLKTQPEVELKEEPKIEVVKAEYNIKPKLSETNHKSSLGTFHTIYRQTPATANRVNVPLDTDSIPKKAPIQPVKKKQISYDDILNSMNMRVGPDGKLEIYSKKLQEHQQMQQQAQKQIPQNKKINIQNLQRPQMQGQTHLVEDEYEPSVLHNSPPLTKKQYKQLIVLDLIRKQQQQRRISQIKSTKLLFPNPNVHIGPRQGQGVNLNRFFNLK